MIFYFTGTDNCLFAAQKLQTIIGGELYSILQLIKQKRFNFDLKDNEFVGFVFPVYFYGVTSIVKAFADKLNITNASSKKTFILATMGGSCGDSCEQLETILQIRNISIGYKFGIIVPDNYIPFFTMPSDEETKNILDKAENELQNIADIMLSGKIGDYNKHKGIFQKITSPFIHLAYPQNTKKFYSNRDCTGCGLCEKVCPVRAIRLKNGIPKWVKKRCEKCLACLHHCGDSIWKR